MGKSVQWFRYIAKSGFVRSVFLRILAIFIVASIAIAGIAFFSFTSEIRRNVLSDRKKQLMVMEESISKRMEEIASIAYSVSQDPDFYLEPVAKEKSSGYEMSATLARYLAGNSFIEHLAYYRLSEPDKIYVSNGERSLTEFFGTSFGLDKEQAEENIRYIRNAKQTQVALISYGEKKIGYFSYLYPLPQLSANPQAFVLMLIPVREVTPLLDALLASPNSEVAVFDAQGREIFRQGQLGESFPLDGYAREGQEEEAYRAPDGAEYVLQKMVSAGNGWTYVSAIRQSDTLSGLANRQLKFILMLLLLMFVAILAMLVSIIVQYKPISNLAETVVGKSPDAGAAIDERVLLSNTISTLKDDSAQKQKFETAYHEAEAASKAKSAFLSNMSHDIRTPMNAVIGMTAIALRHADEPEYVRSCLRKVQASSQYLLDIINNVLDMSRIESGRFTLSEEVIELPLLIDGLIALVEPSAEAKGQRLELETEKFENPAVIGDGVRITQIFLNILSNSVKFTPEGGTIRLRARQLPPAEAEYGSYEFVCSDTGIGMPPEFVAQVFDTFSRAKGTDVSKVEGTGLGMAIAKNLVDLMGGTIRCESELGRGTSFTMTLRLKLSAGDRASAGGGANAPGFSDAEGTVVELAGKRILLVEDNAINREIAHNIIGETKAEVQEATDGKEALDAFAGHPAGYYDLILMDLQMPVMNGYEATAAIRSLKRADALTIPIYAMTANTFDEDVRQVKDAGMNGHIGKPYTPAGLYRLLDQALGAPHQP